MSEAKVFTSLEQAEAFKAANGNLLGDLEDEVSKIPGVAWTEIWLCGNVPSHIRGMNIEDETIVCLKI